MTPSNINRLKSLHRIQDVVGRYVSLQRKGKNFLGLCPFHPDRHPSLTVNPEKQTFTCYACGEKGDVLHFLRQINNCTFAQAVALLGGAVAVAFPAGKESSRLENRKRAPLPADSVSLRPAGEIVPVLPPENMDCSLPPYCPEVMNPAAGGTLLTRCTLPDAAGGTGRMPAGVAMEAIRQNETFLKLLLPYSSGNAALTPASLDFEVGLSPARLPSPWSLMRNRIIFPIRNERGELVAFGARRLTDTDPEVPKYINSATSALYRKSETLYALHRAGEAIRKEGCAYITEGYKDAISMHAAGFRNTVALCGTACSEAHLLLLKKYANHLLVLTDGDRPGHEAGLKITAAAHVLGMGAQHLQLPAGHDPDSLFRTLGPGSFAAYIRHLSCMVYPAEPDLLSLCLHHPHTLLPHKGETCTLAGLLQSILETDNLPFESPLHRELLRLLADGVDIAGSGEGIIGCEENKDESYMPSSLVFEARLLHRHEVSAPDGESLYNTFCRYLFLYCEARLKKEIKASIGCLSATAAAPGHLALFSYRCEQLTYVSEWMGRPGAMGVNWG